MKMDPEKVADLVEELHVEGYETLVAEMPETGEVRIFVDAASKRYNKKVSTILPTAYKKHGMRWLGVYKGKLIVDKAKAAKILTKAKTDKATRLRATGKPGGKVFLKTGKIVVMTQRDIMAHVMSLRRAAGYKPVHKRPGVGPKISKALKRTWKEGTGKYGAIKKGAAAKK